MSKIIRTTDFPETWQLPSHVILCLGPRTSAYGLVIPVITEGERIKRQLEKLHDLKLQVDVFIADGGSTNGSLDPAFLEKVAVIAGLLSGVVCAKPLFRPETRL